ncbi:hypothetical protein AcW1_006647 [Taiwanofungus camphoratus]|nr:hypothetical protein AcV5_009235 [Antrodia cinnamomea]KAI0954885.1 hypothetical protein AcW1_006647 [Antrodia cinnamomea]
MAPPKTGKGATKDKKEKLFHPQSRKAGQLVRTQFRKTKLSELARARSKKQGSQIDVFSFFYHAIPSEGVLTLEDLHTIVRDIWLTRFDAELEAERASRRKGRPKSVKEQKLEEMKLREAEEYRTGIEVIDLTDSRNVDLFRRWDQMEAAYISQLRFIRISSSAPDAVVVSRPGKHPTLKQSDNVDNMSGIQEMDTDEAPLLSESLSRFASSMIIMDGPA